MNISGQPKNVAAFSKVVSSLYWHRELETANAYLEDEIPMVQLNLNELPGMTSYHKSINQVFK